MCNYIVNMSDDPASSSPSPFDAMLCFDVYAANLAFGRVYKPLLDPLGLTYPQFLVMLSLWMADGQSVGRIGETLGLDSSTLTPLIKRLEGASLVTRLRDTRDERRVLVSLTPQGAALKSEADRVLTCVTRNTGLESDTARQLRGQLRQLRRALQQPLEG